MESVRIRPILRLLGYGGFAVIVIVYFSIKDWSLVTTMDGMTSFFEFCGSKS